MRDAVSDVDLPRRLPGIDVLRALAASAVLLAHLIKVPWGVVGGSSLAARAWSAGENLGTWGVGLFFVLSGLCIHLPLARKLARDGQVGALELRPYFRRRFRRIYPPHALVILLSWGLAAWLALPARFPAFLSVPTAGQLVAHVFMVHTFVPGATYSINTVLWTIALEAHFYLLYPLLLRWRRRYRMETLCGILFGVMIVSRVLDHVLPPALRLLTCNFPGRWWEWVLGAVLAERLASVRFSPVPRRVVLVTTGISAVAICWASGLPHGVQLCAILGPFLYATVVWLATRMEVSDGWLDRVFLNVGFRSYSLYLTHPLALSVAMAYFWKRPSTPIVELFAAALLSYLFMMICFFFVERRFLPTGARAIVDPGAAWNPAPVK